MALQKIHHVFHHSVQLYREPANSSLYTVTTCEMVITCKKDSLVAGLVSGIVIQCPISFPTHMQYGALHGEFFRKQTDKSLVIVVRHYPLMDYYHTTTNKLFFLLVLVNCRCKVDKFCHGFLCHYKFTEQLLPFNKPFLL